MGRGDTRAVEIVENTSHPDLAKYGWRGGWFFGPYLEEYAGDRCFLEFQAPIKRSRCQYSRYPDREESDRLRKSREKFYKFFKLWNKTPTKEEMRS